MHAAECQGTLSLPWQCGQLTHSNALLNDVASCEPAEEIARKQAARRNIYCSLSALFSP